MEDGEPVVDAATLQQLRALQSEHEPSIVDELVDDFLERVPARLSRMRDALATDNAEALEHEAHGLTGSSGALGVRRLYVRSKALEEHVRREGVTNAAFLLEAVERAWDEARPALIEVAGSL